MTDQNHRELAKTIKETIAFFKAELKNDAAEFGDRTASFSEHPIPNTIEGDTSMNEDTTTVPKPATISRKELWAQFVNLKIERKCKVGEVECPDEMDGTYTAADFMHSFGEFGELESLSEHVVEVVMEDDDPLWALETLINGIDGYANDLRIVRDGFSSFARALETDDDVPDDQTRYRLPGAPFAKPKEAV